MLFKLMKSELKTALLNVMKSVATKNENRALECVLFELKSREMILTGYNLEQGITTVISAESMDSGCFLAEPKLLSNMINKLSTEEITFELDEGTNVLNISSGKTHFTLSVLSSEGYPSLPDIDSSQLIEIDQQTLKSMVNQTIFAVSQNDTKPILTGELFEIENGTLNVVAIDGFRLAIRTEKSEAKDTNVVIPASALSKVVSVITDKDTGNCQLIISNKHVTFKLNNYSIFTRLLTGEFHNYKKSIPTGYKTEVIINTREMIECLDRCQLLINEKVKSPARLIFKDNQIFVSCKSNLGKIEDIIGADVIGDEVEIGFNVRFLIEALKASCSDKVRLLISGALSPMIVNPLENNEFTFLVLPVRLKNE